MNGPRSQPKSHLKTLHITILCWNGVIQPSSNWEQGASVPTISGCTLELPSSVVLILAKISALVPACSCNSEGTSGVYLPIFLPVHPYRLCIVLLLDSPLQQNDITMTIGTGEKWNWIIMNPSIYADIWLPYPFPWRVKIPKLNNFPRADFVWK